jgi:polar amino acid transport system substrate-binding protein
MKLIKSQLLIISLLVSLNFTYFESVKAENILEEIEQTGVLKVAIREDAVPFGYRDNNNNLKGICLDFFSLLKKQLSKKLNRNIITVNLFISNLYNRFELVENNLVHLECGPNTIRKLEEYEVEFSQPFFITGTQLLVKNELADKINTKENLTNITIGLLRYTTTEKFIKNKYPDAEFEFFQGSKGNLRAIQAVQQNRINAFANDGILLIGEAILLGLPLNQKYTLIPETPMTCEKYGLILPKNDPDWHNFVNSVINSTEEKQIIKDWFSVLNSQIHKNQELCQDS